MKEDFDSPPQAPFEAGPTWATAVQAVLIGLVAGLALHAIVSIVVVQGSELWPARQDPTECQKSEPQRDAVSPPAPSSAPRTSAVTDRATGALAS